MEQWWIDEVEGEGGGGEECAILKFDFGIARRG